MKFRLIIDKSKDEMVVATVKQRTSLIDEIQTLVENDNKMAGITRYNEEDIEILKKICYTLTADGNILIY